MEVHNFKPHQRELIVAGSIDDWYEADAVSRVTTVRTTTPVTYTCDYCRDEAEWREDEWHTVVCSGCRAWFGSQWDSDSLWTYIGSGRDVATKTYEVKEPESVDAIMARHQLLFEERRQQRQLNALTEFDRGDSGGEFINIAAPNGEIIQVRLDVEDSYAWRVS